MRQVSDSSKSTERKSANSPKAMAVPFRERIACSVDEACTAGGFGRTTAYELIASGKLKTKKLGKRRLVLIDSLINLIDRPGGSEANAA
jgi:hypothetical protein